MISADTVLILGDESFARSLTEGCLRAALPNMQCTVCFSIAEIRTLLESAQLDTFDLVVFNEHLVDGHAAELLGDPTFSRVGALCITAASTTERVVRDGAFYVSREDIGGPLFSPLIEALIERNRLQRRLGRLTGAVSAIDSVQTLMRTLQHEINNPLGVIMGAAHVVESEKSSDADRRVAANLLCDGARRIQDVIDKLSQTISLSQPVSLETTEKANYKVYQVPGDAPWEKK